jgi:hypothetical protein
LKNLIRKKWETSADAEKWWVSISGRNKNHLTIVHWENKGGYIKAG